MDHVLVFFVTTYEDLVLMDYDVLVQKLDKYKVNSFNERLTCISKTEQEIS